MRILPARRLAVCQAMAKTLRRAYPRAHNRTLPLTISLALLGALTLTSASQARDWTPRVEQKTYAITGTSPMELYQSIGARGPAVGVQAIAYTTFKLTWRRDYQPQADGACVLVSARPNLNLIYMLPKPSRPLPPSVASGWARFVAGVEVHEREHGRHIIEMVAEIQAFSTGLRAENDAKCQKVRAVLQQRLGELSNQQRSRGRAFDSTEMSPGGNVHQLILAFLNGA